MVGWDGGVGRGWDELWTSTVMLPSRIPVGMEDTAIREGGLEQQEEIWWERGIK